jgi:hypothetical protein
VSKCVFLQIERNGSLRTIGAHVESYDSNEAGIREGEPPYSNTLDAKDTPVNRRVLPVAVILSAILLFTYAAFLMPCGCFGMAMGLHPGFGHGPQPKPGQKEELIAVHSVYLAFGFVLILAGVGLLRLMPSARWAAFGAIACHFVAAGIHDVYVVNVVPRMRLNGADLLLDGEFWLYIIGPTLIPVVFAAALVGLLSTSKARAAFTAGAR